jgi:hypothetical protein
MPRSNIKRPAAKVRAGHWPHAPHGTTYIDVTDANGAKCTIELQASFSGSLKVQMYYGEGAIHLCSPVQCVWASSSEADMAAHKTYLHRLRYGC